MKRNFVSYYGRKLNSFFPLSTGLRGLDEESVHDLLQNVKDKKLSLMKLNETCRELKKLQTLRKLFVKEVGSISWEEAVAKFPHYTTDDQLKQFLNITVRNDATPPSFLHHCQKALKSLTNSTEGNTSTFVAIEKKHENETYIAAMLKIEPEAVVYNDITKHLPQFSGFGLAFRSTVTMMEDEIDEKVYNHCNYACFCYISVSQLVFLCFRWDGFSEPSSPSTLWRVRQPMWYYFHALWSSFQGCPRK